MTTAGDRMISEHLAHDGERGSALIAAMMLLFVLSILGLALFDTAMIDARLAMTSVDSYRALETAQAGMQLAMYRLYRQLCGGDDDQCANPPADMTWVSGSIDGQPFPVSTGAYQSFDITPGPPPTAFLGPFDDPRGAGFPSENYAGSYTIELKNITKGEASGRAPGSPQDLGIPCLDASAPDSAVCPHLIYVRVHGLFGRTVNEQPTVRVVQAVVQARASGARAGSVAVLAETIAGTAEIHGSVHVVPCGSPPCNAIVLGAGGGIRNSYSGTPTNPTGMPTYLQGIVPILPVVRCPPSTQCAGADVETLEATVRIGKPPTDTSLAMDIQSPVASVGEAGSGTANAVTGNLGKPTMDAVYLGRGCDPAASPACSDVVGTNPANAYADRPIRAYDIEPPASFPLLDAPSRVAGVTAANYAACSGPAIGAAAGPISCNSNGQAVSGTGDDFLVSRAFRILATTTEDPRPNNGCDADGLYRILPGGPCLQRNLLDLLTRAPNPSDPLDAKMRWTDATPTFRKTFACPAEPLLTCDAGGIRISGSVRGPGLPTWVLSPPALQLEWCGADWAVSPPCIGPSQLSVYACVDTTCATRQVLGPTTAGTDIVYPLLVYVDGRLRICEACDPGAMLPFTYRGHAIFLVRGSSDDLTADRGSMVLDIGLLAVCYNSGPNLCTGAPGSPAFQHATFPAQSLFTFLTPGNIFLAGDSGIPVRARDYMGRFYAGWKLKTAQQINLVGSATARTIDLGNLVPRFWEVKLPLAPSAFPNGGPQLIPARGVPRWRVTPQRWKECTGSVTNQPC